MSRGAGAPAQDAVIVLHGLARTARPMQKLADALQGAGFHAHNLDYPSRTARIENLVEAHLAPVVQALATQGAGRVHFVGHSMGGILVRQYLATHALDRLGRVVTIGTPHRGSELVDRLRRLPPFAWINGPAHYCPVERSPDGMKRL